MENHSESFKLLYAIHSLPNFADKEEIKRACKHLQIVLFEEEDCDMNDDELFEKLKVFEEMLPSKIPSAQVLSCKTKHGCMDKLFSYLDQLFNIGRGSVA